MTDVTARSAHPPEFEALFNFRDLGGHPTSSGARTVHGRVFRADGVHRCAEADITRLEQIGMARVIDLRTERERANDGCFDEEHHSIDYRHVPVLEEVRGVAGAAAEERPVEERQLALLDTYRKILAKRGERLVEVLELIVSAPGPVVFHCTAGKDRTGIVTALVLSSVGVDDERIAVDYGRSREAMDRLVEWYRANRSHDMSGANLRDDRSSRLLGADPEWMLTVLTELRTDYGDVPGYLRAVGADASLVDGLRARMLG
jgi:protein-tyrosine phosphatase